MAKVHVKYNHYNNEFPLSEKGTLSWEHIDEEYCISFVFQGDYKVRLEGQDGMTFSLVEGAGGSKGFEGLSEASSYELLVEEDEEAGYGNEDLSKNYCPPESNQKGSSANDGASRSTALTAELKGLSEQELRSQTERYKQLKEARDLEDVLYSG